MDGQKVQFQRSVSSISQQNIESFSPKELGRIACGASSFWVVLKDLGCSTHLQQAPLH